MVAAAAVVCLLCGTAAVILAARLLQAGDSGSGAEPHAPRGFRVLPRGAVTVAGGDGGGRPDAETRRAALAADGLPLRPSEVAALAGGRLRPLRVLFALSRELYDGMMDGYLFEEFDACARHPRLDCQLWGPGFPGWWANASLADNIERVWGAPDAFDVHFFQPSFPPMALGLQHPRVVRAVRFNEDWGAPGYNGGVVAYLNASIVMASFAQDQFENAAAAPRAAAYHTDGPPRRVYVHVPMSTDPTVYDAGDASVDAPRPVSALLVGALSPTCYPLRTRLARLIDAGALGPDAVVRKHAGYTLPSAQARHAQRADYARHMASAKVVLVTASHYGYRLQKYAEAALSGALMMGSIPAEDEALFRSIMVELREDDSDDYIAATVAWWLAHDAERKALVRRAMAAARAHFTWDVQFADRLLEAYARLARGEIGWWFPQPFSVREPRRNVCDCNERASDDAYTLAPRCPHVPLPMPAAGQ